MSWNDPVILLVQDPDLFTTKELSANLADFISGLAERRISKLCNQGVAILKQLEKINALFRTWEFMLMDYNLDRHFGDEGKDVHSFNQSIAERVMDACKDHQTKLYYIGIDIDNLTKISRTLTPIEYISDLGTLLTLLVLRSIRTKNEVQERTTVAYSKAKLILIGKELDEIAEPDVLAQYKQLLGLLIKQLNEAIEEDDTEGKYECLAVISDMELMFETFKAEKLAERQQQLAVVPHEYKDYVDLGKPSDDIHAGDDEPQPYFAEKEFPHDPYDIHDPNNYDKPISPPLHQTTMFEDDLASEYNLLYTLLISQSAPLVRSITKSPTKKFPRPELTLLQELYRTSITEEMPYLMLAFSLAKNITEDVQHYKNDTTTVQKTQHKTRKPKTSTANNLLLISLLPNREANQNMLIPRSLGDSALYLGLSMLKPLPQSFLKDGNNTMLARLGIKPQVISVLTPYTEEDNKENTSNALTPLTRENLRSLHDLVD